MFCDNKTKKKQRYRIFFLNVPPVNKYIKLINKHIYEVKKKETSDKYSMFCINKIIKIDTYREISMS